MMRRYIVLLTALSAITTTVYADSMKELVSSSGVTGGVAVHLGCGDGTSTATLHSGDRLLVYGLDTDVGAVEKAKACIASRNIYGQVSAETYDGKNLPFGDNIVNLMIVDDPADLSCSEILRVLVPKGVVLVKPGSGLLKSSGLKKEGSFAGWEKHRKPWPEDIDEWTHFLYGPGNNAVSRDKRVGKPEHVQWFAGPEYTRDHDALASMSAMTTSNGRVFYIYDEGPVSVIHQPADWKLISRDAFNGKLLWKREIPTWMTHLYNFRAGPVQLTRRLVSVDDEVYVTLGFDAPVTKLDAATGETLLTYNGSDKAEELICHDGTLLVVTGDPEFMIEKADGCEGYWERAEEEEATIAKQIMAYDAETGKLKWKLDRGALKGLVPLSLCASGERVFYLDSQQLHCLDAENGKELWASGFETKGIFIRAYTPTVVAHDDVIMCMTVDRLQAFSVETGKELWENEGSNGFGSPADLFVIDGKAWIRSKKTALAIDIHTGELATTLPYVTNQHHHRCFRNKATENCMIIGYSGIQIFDLQDGTTDLNQWVRGLCQYGMMPANGYIYVPPDPCRCYADVKINGFYVLSEKNSLDDIEVKPVLEKGKQYGLEKTSNGQSGAWPTYRGNAARNGGTDVPLPEKLSVKWEANIGASVTASVIAESKVYVAERDAYTVYCLDVGTGNELWRFMANGPVDSPPTIESGFCVFGCGDGSVYCLNAENGGLVWRFKVSELERRIGGEDRLEAPWRINGAVLVLDDTVYFSAGRSSHLDGGIKLYGVDLVTGEKKHYSEIKSKADSRAGALVDMLVERGGEIKMRNATFDRELNPQGDKTSVRGMLDGSWFHRQAGAGGKGQFSVQNEAGTFSVGNPYAGLKERRSGRKASREGNKWNQVGHLHQKYTRYLHKEWFPVGVTIQGKGWSIEEDFQSRAMLVAGERLYLAGWLDEVAVELKTGRSLKNNEPRVSVLRVYSTEDGGRISEYKLDSEPVWDSAAAAYGKLFLSLKSGKLICMGG